MNIYACKDIATEIESLEKEIALLKKNPMGNLFSRNQRIESKTKELEEKRKSYADNGCASDLTLTKCADLQYKILQTQNIIKNAFALKDTTKANVYVRYLDGLNKEFDSFKCASKITEYESKPVQEAIETYTQIDEERIKKSTQKLINQRIIFGGAFLILATILIITLKGKSNE